MLDFKLLSAFDAESGIFRMAMLESTKPRGEPVTSAVHYKAIELSIAIAQLHHTDKQDLHMQAVRMIHKDMNVKHAK